MLEAFLLNQLIVNGNIFYCLEKGDLYTQIFQFSRKFKFFWVGWSGWANLSGKGGFTLKLLSSLSSSTFLCGEGGWLFGRILPDLGLIS